MIARRAATPSGGTLAVEGRDAADEAYLIRMEHRGRSIRAAVPEHLLAERGGARPTHQAAYEALADRRRAVQAAVAALAEGRTPRAPYDAVTLRD